MVSLVSMPWAGLESPSIQLGILTQLLRSSGFNVSSHSLYIEAGVFFVDKTRYATESQRVTVDDYQYIANHTWRLGVGDWIFGVPPFVDPDPAKDEQYCDYLRGEGLAENLILRAHVMRGLAQQFLERCVSELMEAQPEIVGFSSTFSQNIASLAIAKMLKQRSPTVSVIFGGANCDGPMGAALHKSFPWVDFVV
jgi:hypothetical protein